MACQVIYLFALLFIHKRVKQTGELDHTAAERRSRPGADGSAAVVMETAEGGASRSGTSLFCYWRSRGRTAPLPLSRYHRFNRVELLLRSVTTKWLHNLRRRRESPERFVVRFINSYEGTPRRYARPFGPLGQKLRAGYGSRDASEKYFRLSSTLTRMFSSLWVLFNGFFGLHSLRARVVNPVYLFI